MIETPPTEAVDAEPIAEVQAAAETTTEAAAETVEAGETVPTGASALPIEEDPEERIIAAQKQMLAALDELLEFAEPAKEFEAPSGRRYRLTDFSGWSGRQNLAARRVYSKVMEKFKATKLDGAKVNAMTVLELLLDEDDSKRLWEDFFSILYIPEDAKAYDPKVAKENRDDFLDLTNELASGALCFFITSSLSSIPRGILSYFQTIPMVALILRVLEERQLNVNVNAAST